MCQTPFARTRVQGVLEGLAGKKPSQQVEAPAVGAAAAPVQSKRQSVRVSNGRGLRI
ncbi:hypothetical protein CPT_Palo_040 [Rhizobium phage Palo]|uniref:Uncharacterized protein n=1 Tax=Rhizobium phage Palo TaxID=2767573 RepID=A0A7L8G625_9CAUD|nr:hypothetical protein CPT_Palo_040 [Rhizobium phage Palo]